jgi:hypothetical protein
MECKKQTAFYCSPFITGTNLKSKWNRMAKEYATKAALEREGANLSGLEEPSEVETLMISPSLMKSGT